MAYLRDRAIILKKEPFREQDRRYTLYGKEHGLLVAVARGSSLQRSKQAGHLEPFSEAEVMIAKGAAFDKLAVARTIASAARVPPRLPSYAILGAFFDLVISLNRPGVSDHRIFDLVCEMRDACTTLPAEISPERARLLLSAATLKLLDLLGFAPPFGDDAGLSAQSVTLLKFLRRFSLADALRVTAATDVLNAASARIEDAVSHTPLEKPPHGPSTLRFLLAH